MGTAEQLLEHEERFWTEGADFYRAMLTPDARMVFGDPVGSMGKAAAVASISDAARWHDVEFADVEQVAFSPDTVLLTYRVTATRGGDDKPYRARASSLYLRRDGAWLLAFHQQTPPQG